MVIANANADPTLVAADRAVVASVRLAVAAARKAPNEVRPQWRVKRILAMPRAVPRVHRRPVERMA